MQSPQPRTYRFDHAFVTMMLDALGLKGQLVKKMTLIMNIDEPVRIEFEGFASIDGKETLPKILESREWVEAEPEPIPVPTPEPEPDQ